MTGQGRTFSESWHRVAGLRIGLRPTVEIRKQYFRGEKWYVLHDPFNNQFFRFRPESYAFIARLSPKQSVEEVWQQCLELFPDQTPGQEDVIRLLSQLYYANLLYFTSRPDSAKIFERYTKRRQRELQSKLMSIMFMRLPLFDPDRFLRHSMPLLRLIISPLGAVVWLAVIAIAVKLVIENWSMAFDQAQGILAPGNLPLLYMALVVIKGLHEFGHAAVCRRFGGEVHTMGIMLLVFTPLPYMDATSSWAFRERWPRILVGAAGIFIEMLLAGLAVFVWVQTGPGALHSLAYNVMFIASVSTILFNANPLLRFDGYYILSDLLDIPNMHARSKGHLRHVVEKYAFGYKDSHSPTQRPSEAALLSLFGIFSLIYRVVIFTGIILFVADKFLLVGLIMAIICIVSWGLIPIVRFAMYLASNPRLARTRPRALVVSGTFGALVGFFLFVCPFPQSFKAPGVMESENLTRVFAQAPGLFKEQLVASGSYVNKGEPLLMLVNKDIELDLVSAQAQLRETLALMAQARQEFVANLAPLQKRLKTVKTRITDCENWLEDLTVRAGQSGIWHAPRLRELPGRWVQRGAYFGDVVDLKAFYLAAVVSQDEASRLFQDHIEKVSVRIKGQAKEKLKVTQYHIIPFEQKKLPSPAIGWRGGGVIATSFKDESGIITQEPFFRINASLAKQKNVHLLHGRTGIIRLGLPPKPLYYKLYRNLRQLLQERYRL